MFNRPPTHRADATPVLILHADPAWDHERIDKEIVEAEAENKRRTEAGREDMIDTDAHPYMMYRRGETRMDPDAQSNWRGQPLAASDYLKPDAAPVRFILRRLRWDEWHRVMDLARSGGTKSAERACQYGLVDIEGDGGYFQFDTDSAVRTDAEMQRLYDYDRQLILEIGLAVNAASKQLTSAEKKR